MKESLWEVVRQGWRKNKAISCRYLSKCNLFKIHLELEAGEKLPDTKKEPD